MPSGVKIIGLPVQVEIEGKRFYVVELADLEGRHFYRLLRSVTTICKGARLPSFLDKWQNEQIESLGVKGFYEALDAKAHDGTVVHKFIEEHVDGASINRRSIITLDDGKQYGFDDDTWPMFESYLRWEEKYRPEHVWQEQVLFSLRHGYAGRSDRKIILNGKKLILDYKSSKAVQDGHCEQGSAYYMADREMENDCDGFMILALGANNKQGYSQRIVTDPYDMHNYFSSFCLKNELINLHSHISA